MAEVKGGGGKTHLLILVGEKSLKYFTARNNWMPAHPNHPALQPLHAHLNKLLLKSPWNKTEKQTNSQHRLFIFALRLSVGRLPVTCLSGKEGMGMADPNLSNNLSYSQSKCLYL